MAISYDVTARNNLLDNGASTAYSGATVSIQTAADAELVSVTLPSYNAAASGTISMSSQPTGTATADGTAAKYVITFTGGGTESGTVSATGQGGDMTIDDVNIVTNGVVTITNCDVTQPAG